MDVVQEVQIRFILFLIKSRSLCVGPVNRSVVSDRPSGG